MRYFLDKITFSNVVLTALLVNLLVTQSWVAALVCVPAFINFMAEEWCRRTTTNNDAMLRLAFLESKFQKVEDHGRETRAKVELLQSNSEAITKLAAETKKMVSEGNLAGAFIPRAKRNLQP